MTTNNKTENNLKYFNDLLERIKELSTEDKKLIKTKFEEIFKGQLKIYLILKDFIIDKSYENITDETTKQFVDEHIVPNRDFKDYILDDVILDETKSIKFTLSDVEKVNELLSVLGSDKYYHFRQNEFFYGDCNIREFRGRKIYDINNIDVSTELFSVVAGQYIKGKYFMFNQVIDNIIPEMITYVDEKLKTSEEYQNLFGHAKEILKDKDRARNIIYNIVLYHEFGHKKGKEYVKSVKHNEGRRILNELTADFLPTKKNELNFSRYLIEESEKDNRQAKEIMVLFIPFSLMTEENGINNLYSAITDSLYEIYKSDNISRDVQSFAEIIDNGFFKNWIK